VTKQTKNKAKKKKLPASQPSVKGLLLKQNKNQKVAVNNRTGKNVAIKAINSPLDAYFSPHMLDLSQARYIEKVRPAANTKTGQIFYQDLPGGNFLLKLGVFQLLELENSEIIKIFKDFKDEFLKLTGKFFTKVDFSPKLPLAGRGHSLETGKGLTVWQETALINLLVFLFLGLKKVFTHLYSLIRYFRAIIKGWFFKKDEVVSFDNKKTTLLAEPAKELPAERVASNWPDKKAIAPELFESEIRQRKLIASSKITFWPRQFFFKTFVLFALVALAVVLPIKGFSYWQSIKQTKGQVLGQADEALANLKLAQDEIKNLNFKTAEDRLASANQNFVSAQNQLQDIRSFLTVVAGALPNNTLRSGKNLLALGENMSKAGEHLLSGLNQLTENSDFSLTSRIKNFKLEEKLALAKLKLAQENFKKVNIAHLPAENREQFYELQKRLPLFIKSLEDSEKIIDFAINFLGDNSLRRYLLVFQNDNELRATGGFMGSFALVDIKSGEIQKIDLPKGGTYDVRAGLNQLVLAPQPLQLINGRWEFQDANWWPDWPTSAKKITWFYNKSGGPTIDGVIAINSDWLGKLLAVLGEIQLAKYSKTISAANFEQEIQKSIELEAKDKKQPKEILADLAPQLIDGLVKAPPEKLPELFTVLNDGLKSKDIQIYLNEAEQQKFIAQNNWDGRVKSTDKDYLQVVAANIGGGKTDNAIRQEVYHQASIMADGSVIDRVIINRHHFGPIDENFTTAPNRVYLRVYVPQGSQLIKAAGFAGPADKEFQKPEDYLKSDEDLKNEQFAFDDLSSKTRIYNEKDKTVFGNWAIVSPGESKDFLLVYKLPFKVGVAAQPKQEQKLSLKDKIIAAFRSEKSYDSYSLLVQKQSGEPEAKIVSEVVYPDKFSAVGVYPAASREDQKIVFEDKQAGDSFFWAGFSF